MSEATLQALFKCPWCGHVNCLLGLTAHALGVHRKNLLAWACKHSPRHQHAHSRGRTEVRYVVIPQRPGQEKPKRREEQRKPKPKGREKQKRREEPGKPGKPRRQVLKSQEVARAEVLSV